MIQLRNVSIGYQRPLLSGLSYTFENNTIYGLLASSGFGKTTLLRTIAGLHQPLSGQVFVDGCRYSSACANPTYMMHQRYSNFGWKTCLDNVLLAERNKTRRDRAQAAHALQAVGLSGYEDVFPSGLSGGMQQRLALARTLYVKPKHLLMDEPLSALDDQTRSSMQQLIIDIHQQTRSTVLLVTHSREEAEKMCDKIIQLEDFI